MLQDPELMFNVPALDLAVGLVYIFLALLFWLWGHRPGPAATRPVPAARTPPPPVSPATRGPDTFTEPTPPAT